MVNEQDYKSMKFFLVSERCDMAKNIIKFFFIFIFFIPYQYNFFNFHFDMDYPFKAVQFTW